MLEGEVGPGRRRLTRGWRACPHQAAVLETFSSSSWVALRQGQLVL